MKLLRRIACMFSGHYMVEGALREDLAAAPWPAIGKIYRDDYCDRCGKVEPRFVTFVFEDEKIDVGAVP